MQLSSSNVAPASPGGHRNGFDASRCRGGDRLAARITAISPSGRTALQFTGFQAVSARALGGRVGDAVLFEIAPRATTDPGASHQPRGPSSPPANQAPGPIHQIEIRHNGRCFRLNVFLKTEVLQTPAPRRSSPPPALASNFARPGMSLADQATMPLQSLGMVSAWLSRLRKNLVRARPAEIERPAPRVLAGRTEGQGAHRHSDPLESMTSKQLEPHGQTPADPCCCEFHLGKGLVRFRFKQNGQESTNPGAEPILEAAFVLYLETIGALRTDIRMGGDTLAVAFSMEDSAGRQRLVDALPDLQAALSPLARHCRCRVEVSAGGIHAFFQEEGGFPAAYPFEARI